MSETEQFLFIPADTAQPPRVAELRNGRKQIEVQLGGYVESARYDYDALMWVGDRSAINGSPFNQRATDYIKTHSAAKARWVNAHPSDGLYGDVVVTGSDSDGYPTGVPARFIELFGVFAAPTPHVARQNREQSNGAER